MPLDLGCAAAVFRQRAPIADVNSCVATQMVPFKALTVIELQPLLRTRVIRPGGKVHARQPSHDSDMTHEQAAQVCCPSESAPGHV